MPSGRDQDVTEVTEVTEVSDVSDVSDVSSVNKTTVPHHARGVERSHAASDMLDIGKERMAALANQAAPQT